MNDELQKQLAAMLAALSNYAGDATKFAAEQIQPLVREKVLFGRIDETVQLLLCIACAWGSFVLGRRCLKRLTEQHYDDDIGWILGIIATGIAFVLSVTGGSYQAHETLLAWFAPRLYIVEWLMAMVHK